MFRIELNSKCISQPELKVTSWQVTHQIFVYWSHLMINNVLLKLNVGDNASSVVMNVGDNASMWMES